MYRIALIQNESEMMRYSWADIRPMVERLGYLFDGFTAENIEDLYSRLTTDRYDAVIVSSNACNDKAVRESLNRHRMVFDDFLKRGKGLLVSFQMRMADFKYYEFLPDQLRVTATNRIYSGEAPQEGNLVTGEGQERHTLLCYPNRVNLAEVKSRCLTNNMVEGLYWTYLVSEHPQNYVTVIEDTTYELPRALLISSREDLTYRIVISSLALDWQKHEELWENAVRYVVEGRPSIAVISKSGSSLFDFRFLISSLEITKLPYAEYIQETITPDKIALDGHDTYVLDPAWSEPDVERFLQASLSLIEAGRARVFYFRKTGQGLVTLQAVSNVREYQIIAHNAITWLVSQFPDAEDQGYWAGSFWCTLDVLSTLNEFGVPVTQFKDKILKAIEKHDRNGSYDEVLGATCAMLEVYSLFLGKDHARIQRALDWILAHVYNKTLFEQATAYDVLTRFGVTLSEQKLAAFKNEVVTNLPLLRNEFLVYRYAKTLLACGLAKEAGQVAMQLENLQSPSDGRWVNIPNTASIVDLLIDIQKAIGSPKRNIDEMIFKGIQFIRSSYTPTEYSWKSDVSATAKSLKALRAFEQRISFPIDVIATSLQSGDVRARNYIAIEAASALNIRLQNRVNDLTAQLGRLQRSIDKMNKENAFAVRLSTVLTVIVAVGITFGLLMTRYLAQNKLLAEVGGHIRTFVSESATIALPVLAVVTLAALLYVLRRLGKSPKWLDTVLSPFIKTERD